LTAFAAIT